MQLLIILASVALAAGLIALVARSETLKHYGVLGLLRRKFSGGREHSPYEG